MNIAHASNLSARDQMQTQQLFMNNQYGREIEGTKVCPNKKSMITAMRGEGKRLLEKMLVLALHHSCIAQLDRRLARCLDV